MLPSQSKALKTQITA